MGETYSATQHLEAAAGLTGGDSETRRWLNLVSSDPSAALDREVNRQAVKDHERPLWEAFEGIGGGDDEIEPPAALMPNQGQ